MMKHHLLFILFFCVYILWLTGITVTFIIRQGIDSAPLKQLIMAEAQLLMQKIILLLRWAVVGFATVDFFCTEDGSSETKQVKNHGASRASVGEGLKKKWDIKSPELEQDWVMLLYQQTGKSLLEAVRAKHWHNIHLVWASVLVIPSDMMDSAKRGVGQVG